MKTISYGNTDIGRTRSTNQDSIFVDNENGCFVVADGMGGHRGGDIASQKAVQTIAEKTKNKYFPIKNFLLDLVTSCNKNIFDIAAENEELSGMGTTMTVCLLENKQLCIAHVGDSRAYLIHEQQIFQLTKDHTLVQEKINLGIYSREQALKDPQKNVLIKTVGYEESVEIDYYQVSIEPKDLILICSDGLFGKLSDLEILEIISKQKINETTIKTAVNELINAANLNGGQDNISAILIALI
jgi:serine/threonine protein phosphatase PrpC